MNLKHPVITGLFSLSELEAPCEMVSCQSATAIKLHVLTLVSKWQRTKTGSGLIWESCLPPPPPRAPTDPLPRRAFCLSTVQRSGETGMKRNDDTLFPFTQCPALPSASRRPGARELCPPLDQRLHEQTLRVKSAPLVKGGMTYDVKCCDNI